MDKMPIAVFGEQAQNMLGTILTLMCEYTRCGRVKCEQQQFTTQNIYAIIKKPMANSASSTSWKLQSTLFYPTRDTVEEFSSKAANLAFLYPLFASAPSTQPFHERVPLLKPLFEKLPELEKSKSIEEINDVLVSTLSPLLKSDPLHALANVVALFFIILRENQLGPIPNLLSPAEVQIWDVPSIKELLISNYSRSGENIYRKTGCLFFIHILSWILENPFIDELESAPLWKARHSYMVNNLLSSNIPHLKDASIGHYKTFIANYLKIENIHCFETATGREYKVEGPAITEDSLKTFGMLNVEFAYCALTFYKYSLAEHCLETARIIGGINHKLTGKMGRRTKYQERAISQLMLDITSTGGSKSGPEAKEPQNVQLEEDSILYEKPVIEGADPLLKQEALSLYDQIYLNAFCRYMMLTRPMDQIMHETLNPYINKVLEKSHAWIVFSCSLLHRSRNETDSTKRKERSLLQMQALVDQFKDKEPGFAERFSYSFCAGYPLYWGLMRELARNYMQIGCFSSAYEMLKDMELYEDSIQCLFLSGRKSEATAKAQEILKKGGREVPNIMCLLADFSSNGIEEKEKIYKEAWEVSKGKCPRALRSLGRLYYELKKYKEAVECLDTALKINTLYPSSWFTLGCAYLQLKMWDKAIYAFGWVVQVDENSSDGWSNLGVTYTQMNKLKEAVSCYEQALKITRNSWKIWQNYIILSLEIPDINRVLGAIRQLIAMDMQERVPVPLLAKLVSCVLSLPSTHPALHSYEEQVVKLIHEMAHNDSKNTPLWGLYADTYEVIKVKSAKEEDKKGEYLKLIDILVKQVRSVMFNPNWDHFEQVCKGIKENRDLAGQVMEILKNLSEKHKEGGIEMDPEIKLLIQNAVMKLEQYKGTKINFNVQQLLIHTQMHCW
eukprot:TRINITY_DN620_c0_g2_i1.p1 TRINITY_DN620_c0_g2~~TRINITY_DN620_c0_g2_i1.p1  ORF type:complete len:900 (-),score=86.41 TRINITY_DN620_c0_g2_i1:11582-14281(-)